MTKSVSFNYKAWKTPYILGFIFLLPYICLNDKQKGMILYIFIFFLVSFLIFLFLYYHQEKETMWQTFVTENYKKDAENKLLHLFELFILGVINYSLAFILSPTAIVTRLYLNRKKNELFKLNYYIELDFNNEEKSRFQYRSICNIVYFDLEANPSHTPNEDEVIYVDRTNNQSLRAYLQEHDKDLKDYIRYSTCTKFTDLKPFCEQLVAKQQEVFNYYAPYAQVAVNWDAETLQDAFLSMLVGKDHVSRLTSGFLHWNIYQEKYAFCPTQPEEEFSYDIQIKYYFEFTNNIRNKPRYRLVKREDLPYDERNDFSMDEDIQNIVDELKEKISKLQESGVSDYFIRELVNKETPNAYKISHLKVTKSFDIILTDYNNMVIEMTPLAKTVFLFFLKHPEGIMLKEISNYKTEIVRIYNRITGRTDADKIEKTINDLVNPMKNRLNENCTRVREAFVSRFEESLAKNYYIHGPWRERKKIDLPRDLVIWED